MIHFENVHLNYGARDIYKGINCLIRDRDRIALVGPNGAGKSTFFRMIMGTEVPDKGDIDIAKHVRFGHLPQEELVCTGTTLFEEVESIFTDIVSLRTKIDDLSIQMGEVATGSDEYNNILHEIGSCEHRLEELEAHKLESKIQSILMGLGFLMGDMERDCGEFSGGWQMRIALAKLLLLEPSILLLDEPTNHLDIVSQRWFEAQLKQYKGSVIIISHDQAFIDTLCSRTFALGNGNLDIYEGNYDYYLREREQRKALLEKAYETQQKQLKKTEDFIERFRAKATKAKQVQSRVKQLDKVERITIESDSDSVNFSFPHSRRSGQVVFNLENICKSYDDNDVIKNLDLKIERGEKIAIVGPNGCGKSTLSRILSGDEPLTSGERTVGHQVDYAFFAQQQVAVLDPEKDVISSLEETATNRVQTYLRSILGAFLFKGDDVFKKVKVLSGGEKSRLALAKILCSPSNCIILDEPTNHIDIQTKDILQNALMEYQGTVIIVSHDRAFMDPIVDKVLEVTHDGIRTLHGNLSEYLQKLDEEEALKIKSASKNNSASSSDSNKLSPKEQRRQRAALQQKLKPLKTKLKTVEKQIEDLEARKVIIEEKLGDETFYKSPESKDTLIEHASIEEKLQVAYHKWEKLEEEIGQASG